MNKWQQEFQDKPVAIFGGGPSLTDPVQLSAWLNARGYGIIGTNFAFKVPGVHACVWCEPSFASLYWRELSEWSGLKLAYGSCAVRGAMNMEHLPTMSLDDTCAGEFRGFGWYRSSGAIAIQAAIASGAKSIHLFGFDGHGGNWHNSELGVPSARALNGHSQGFDQMMDDYRDRGDSLPPILNHSTGTHITAFPGVLLR